MSALRRLQSVLIAVGLVGAGMSVWQHSIDASTDANIPRSYIKKSRFRLPVNLENNARQQVAEVHLYYKASDETTWQFYGKIQPAGNSLGFDFQAPREGEYHFAMVLVDRMGKARPENLANAEAGLIVIYDSSPPTIDAFYVKDEPEGQTFRVAIDDRNPNPIKTRCYFQTRDQVWRSLEAPQASDVYCVPSQAAITGMIRIEAEDKAGNVVTRDVSLSTLQQAKAMQPESIPGLTSQTQGSQVANTQVANTQVANTQVANTQVANTQVANTQVERPQVERPVVERPRADRPVDVARIQPGTQPNNIDTTPLIDLAPLPASPGVPQQPSVVVIEPSAPKSPGAARPSVNVPHVGTPHVVTPSVVAPSIGVPNVGIPAVANPTIDLNPQITIETTAPAVPSIPPMPMPLSGNTPLENNGPRIEPTLPENPTVGLPPRQPGTPVVAGTKEPTEHVVQRPLVEPGNKGAYAPGIGSISLVPLLNKQPNQEPDVGTPDNKEPARPDVDPSIASQSGNREPNKLNRLFINKSQLVMEYQLEAVGASGVGRVEVWLTRDRGRSWQKVGEDPDCKSPVALELPGEGLYGISLVVSNGRGFGAVPPKPGDTPGTWVEVDLTPPQADLLGVAPGTGQNVGTMILRWNANDTNLSNESVDLHYATKRTGPWQPIAKGLRSEGTYRWIVPTDAGANAFIRLVAHDLAGNETVTETPQSVPLDDRSRPRGRLVGITPYAPSQVP